MRARGADVSLRDVPIAQIGNEASKCEWRHAPEARGGFWDLEKVSDLIWDLPREKTVDFRLLAEALGRCHSRWGGGRWKSRNRKNEYFSTYVEEPLNSKVIKSFVPKQRSRKCFSCSEIPMFYVIYIWTLYVHFTHGRIWLWYTDITRSLKNKLTKFYCLVGFSEEEKKIIFAWRILCLNLFLFPCNILLCKQ